MSPQKSLVSGKGRGDAVHVGGQSSGDVTMILQDIAAVVFLEMVGMLSARMGYDGSAVAHSMSIVELKAYQMLY